MYIELWIGSPCSSKPVRYEQFQIPPGPDCRSKQTNSGVAMPWFLRETKASTAASPEGPDPMIATRVFSTIIYYNEVSKIQPFIPTMYVDAQNYSKLDLNNTQQKYCFTLFDLIL